MAHKGLWSIERNGKRFIYLDGELLSTDEALALAVKLVFLADGNMVSKSSTAKGVEEWNENSVFHKAYKKFYEDLSDEGQKVVEGLRRGRRDA